MPSTKLKQSTLWRFGALYLVQGLPTGFFTKQLPLHLRAQGTSLDKLGLLSVLAFPWFFKFLLAPIVDTHWFPSLGRRKSWIIPLQILLFLVMLFAGGVSSLYTLALMIALMNFCTAVQDIAVDGLAIDSSNKENIAYINSMQIVGFKVGILLGGGLIAYLCHLTDAPFQTAFYYMAAIVLVVLLTCVLPLNEGTDIPRKHREHREHREHHKHDEHDSSDEHHSSSGDQHTSSGDQHTSPGEHHKHDSEHHKSHSERHREQSPGVLAALQAVLRDCSNSETLFMLIFIATYKAGEVMADTMFKPYLVDRGHEKTDIALWSGLYGMVASILGSLAGGKFTTQPRRWLFLSALLNLIPQVLRAILVIANVSSSFAIVTVMCLEAFTGGVLSTRVFTWMMTESNKQFAASHYTFLSTVEVTGKFLFQALSGFIAHHHGYKFMFGLGTLFTLLSTLVLLHRPSDLPRVR